MFKSAIYDDFFCIADQCTFSCCKGDWNVSLQKDEMEIYATEPYISKGVNYVKKAMRMRENGTCVFLNEKGLCKLVCKYGPDVLSRTCTRFPRLSRDYCGVEEAFLSNACPKVLDMLANTPTPLAFVVEGEPLTEEYLSQSTVQARDIIIDILQYAKIPLWKRLYIAHSACVKLENCKDMEYVEILLRYSDVGYLDQTAEALDRIPCGIETILPKMRAMYNHVNYANIGKMYFDEYIADSYDKKGDWGIDEISDKRKDFNDWLKNWNAYFENYCVNAVTELLAVESLGEFKKRIIQLIIEVSLAVFTVFENYRMGKRTDRTDIFNISCYYSRIIEHNRVEVNNFVESLLTKEQFVSGDFFVLCKSMDYESEA